MSMREATSDCRQVLSAGRCLRIGLFLALVPLLGGCLSMFMYKERPVVGTWVGIVSPTVFYDEQGIVHRAYALRITGGPRAASGLDKSTPVLLDRQDQVFRPTAVEIGQEVRVSGNIGFFNPKSEDGARPVWAQDRPGVSVPALRVAEVVRVTADR